MGLKEAPLPLERWYSEEGGVPSFLAMRLQGLAFERNLLSLWWPYNEKLGQRPFHREKTNEAIDILDSSRDNRSSISENNTYDESPLLSREIERASDGLTARITRTHCSSCASSEQLTVTVFEESPCFQIISNDSSPKLINQCYSSQQRSQWPSGILTDFRSVYSPYVIRWDRTENT